jgi:hypothetical protein
MATLLEFSPRRVNNVKLALQGSMLSIRIQTFANHVLLVRCCCVAYFTIYFNMLTAVHVAGASCPDGKLFLSKVPGSVWVASAGVYRLSSCPRGHELVSATQECAVCPVSCFCVGGATPHSPCPQGLFAPPGAKSADSCAPVVFVIVTVSIPVVRVEFTTQVERNLQSAFENNTGVGIGRVVIFSVSDSQLAGWIRVVTQVAFPDAISAHMLSSSLNSSTKTLGDSLGANGFDSFTLESVKITSCPAGFELLETGQCFACPPNYYCVGGINNGVSCPTGSFSLPGANSSDLCLSLVIVQMTLGLPMPKVNFTDQVKNRFVFAVAVSLGMPTSRILVLSVDSADSVARRGVSASPSINIKSEIVCDDASTAHSVSDRINVDTLNSNLASQQLPRCVIQSTRIIGDNTQGGYGTPVSVILGASLGCFFVLVILSIASYYLARIMFKYYAHRSFLNAFHSAKAGDEATEENLPYELRNLYDPQRVLGKGAFGCVLHAVTKKGRKEVAIKIIASERGTFSARETRQACVALRSLSKFGVHVFLFLSALGLCWTDILSRASIFAVVRSVCNYWCNLLSSFVFLCAALARGPRPGSVHLAQMRAFRHANWHFSCHR